MGHQRLISFNVLNDDMSPALQNSVDELSIPTCPTNVESDPAPVMESASSNACQKLGGSFSYWA